MSINLFQDLKDIFNLSSQSIENLKTGRQEIISKPFYFIMRPISNMNKNKKGKSKQLSKEGINTSIKRKIYKIIDNTDLPDIEGQFITKHDDNISKIIAKYNNIIIQLHNIIKPYISIKDPKSLIRIIQDNKTNFTANIDSIYKYFPIYPTRNIIQSFVGNSHKILENFIDTNSNLLYIYSKLNKIMKKCNTIVNDSASIIQKMTDDMLGMASIKAVNLQHLIDNIKLLEDFNKSSNKISTLSGDIFHYFFPLDVKNTHNIETANKNSQLGDYFKDFYLEPYMIFSINKPEESTYDIIEKIKKSDTNKEFAYSIVSIKPSLTIKVPPIYVTNIPKFTVKISFKHFIAIMCKKINTFNNKDNDEVNFINENQTLIIDMSIIYTKTKGHNIQNYIIFYTNSDVSPIELPNDCYITETELGSYQIQNNNNKLPTEFDRVEIICHNPNTTTAAPAVAVAPAAAAPAAPVAQPVNPAAPAAVAAAAAPVAQPVNPAVAPAVAAAPAPAVAVAPPAAAAAPVAQPVNPAVAPPVVNPAVAAAPAVPPPATTGSNWVKSINNFNRKGSLFIQYVRNNTDQLKKNKKLAEAKKVSLLVINAKNLINEFIQNKLIKNRLSTISKLNKLFTEIINKPFIIEGSGTVKEIRELNVAVIDAIGETKNVFPKSI